jgi:hypothetical protein
MSAYQRQQQFIIFYRQCRYLSEELCCKTADKSAVSGSIGVVKRGETYTPSVFRADTQLRVPTLPPCHKFPPQQLITKHNRKVVILDHFCYQILSTTLHRLF